MAKKLTQSHPIAVSTEGEPTRVMAFLEGLREGLPESSYRVLPLPGGPEAILSGLGNHALIEGLVGSFAGDAWRRPNLATVNLEFFSKVVSQPGVSPDWLAASQLAANHLAEIGLSRCGFVGVRGQFASRQLMEGFQARCDAHALRVDFAPVLPQAQAEWLESQAKPFGLFCTSTAAAARLAVIARETGWEIPRDLAIMTIGETTLASLQAGLELTTIPLPDHALGLASAQLIRQQIEEGIEHPESITVPIPTLQPRASTLRRAGRQAAFDNLLEQLPFELDRDSSVDELAQRSGMSRRAFEITFREKTGHSPAVYLRTLRIDKAKQLLRETALPVADIGTRCGYPEPHVFSATFKRITGKSPVAWRRG